MSEGKSIYITQHSIAATPHAITPVRARFIEFLLSLGLDDNQKEGWKLVLTELVNNVIEHGSHNDESLQVEVCWWADGNSIWTETWDSGNGPPAEKRINPQLPEDPLAEGGRGLFMDSHTFDHINVGIRYPNTENEYRWISELNEYTTFGPVGRAVWQALELSESIAWSPDNEPCPFVQNETPKVVGASIALRVDDQVVGLVTVAYESAQHEIRPNEIRSNEIRSNEIRSNDIRNLRALAEIRLNKQGEYIGCIIDVMGKGISASILAGIFRSQFIAFAYRDSDISTFMERTNQAIETQLGELTMFITAFIFKVDPKTNVMTYSGAGHPPALLYSKNKPVQELLSQGSPLGLFNQIDYEAKEIILHPGDHIVIVTVNTVDLESIKALGADAILSKPFSPRRLQNLIKELLESK